MTLSQALAFSDNVFSDLSAGRSIDRPALQALVQWRREGSRGTLLTIVHIEGRSPRSVGAQMAVREDGAIQGYLTGGCLERELALVAKDLIAQERNDLRRYGRGSPYVDMRLPCGSGLDIYFDQAFDDTITEEIAARLDDRRYFSIETDLATGHKTLIDLPANAASRPQSSAQDMHFSKLVKPPLMLNIYGAGMASVQLSHMAGAMGLTYRVFAGDTLTFDAAAAMDLRVEDLHAPGFAVPQADPWTASAVLFHEHEREIDLLLTLARQQGFYIGTIGSGIVAERRRQILKASGLDEALIARITMQAGLVQKARNASEIAIGIVAEILQEAREQGLTG